MSLTTFELLHKMDAENIILTYNGEINAELLEAVYSMIHLHFEEKKTSPDKKKKLFNILIECLQNVFHHHAPGKKGVSGTDVSLTGLVIKRYGDDSYNIITGNYLLNTETESLKKKLDEVNELSPESLRSYYQDSLITNEFSKKGGAGLGIIEMARKSGNKLIYEFTKVNDEYSFFSLTITIT